MKEKNVFLIVPLNVIVMLHIYSELLEKVRSGEIKTQKQLELAKARFAKEHALPKIPKNAEILNALGEAEYREFSQFLSTKPVRISSGIANIAVMWLPLDATKSCPGNCIYCPQGLPSNRNVPKSYTGTEPTTLRAIRNGFDPYKQVMNRLHHFRILGHPADKCELIVMGGTFPSWPVTEQEQFMKRCFEAFNGCESADLEETQKANETAKNRVIGLTFETRADYCNAGHISGMMRLGATRVEIGVQSTSDKILQLINRGHDCEANIEAIARLKAAGLKLTAHWMPGLTGLYGLDFDEEIELFRQLFTPAYQPDEIKIYPTLVIAGTVLHRLWKSGAYIPLSVDEMHALLIKLKAHVPEHVRIKRVMRDIAEGEVSAGPATTNLRQLVHEAHAMNTYEYNNNKTNTFVCNCIRCREVGLQGKQPERAEMLVSSYDASEGTEYFISFEDVAQKLLLGFCRLRIDDDKIGKVRELHVYGKMARIGEKGEVQHKSLGKQLLEKAEEIARMHECRSMQVTSGVGVREYYRKLGYKLSGYYMAKNLQ